MVQSTTARAAVIHWLIVSAAIGCWLAPPVRAQAQSAPGAELFTFTPKGPDELRIIEQRVQEVVERVMPATVGVIAPSGQGSGVIVSADGYILTAGHVIRDANLPLTIILPDGRRVQGRSLGINRTMDSGLAKITEQGEWPYAPLARSSPLARGQWVISLGHPGGYRSERPPVVRLGRVAVSTRMVIVSNCTLVGGDSGGPLFDFDGRVVGIHSRIGTSTGNNMHIPIDTFLSTWERLAGGEVWGVKLTPSAAGNARGAVLGAYTLDHAGGVQVTSVLEASAAAAAGLKAGDIIIRFDGEAIGSREKLGQELGRRGGGQIARLGVLRDGKTVELTVRLQARQ
jgi:serine protease Do